MYFKKYQPSQAIIFSDGSAFKGFTTINHEIGILATEDPRIIHELETCMRGQRGGVEKITAQQHLELQSQKKSNLKPLWREEWQPRKLQPIAQDGLPARVVVADTERLPTQLAAPPAGSEATFRPKTNRK